MGIDYGGGVSVIQTRRGPVVFGDPTYPHPPTFDQKISILEEIADPLKEGFKDYPHKGPDYHASLDRLFGLYSQVDDMVYYGHATSSNGETLDSIRDEVAGIARQLLRGFVDPEAREEFRAHSMDYLLFMATHIKERKMDRSESVESP